MTIMNAGGSGAERAGSRPVTSWVLILRTMRAEEVTEVEVNGPNNAWMVANGERKPIEGIRWGSDKAFFQDFRNTVKQYMYAPGFNDDPEKCNTIYEGGLTVEGKGGYHARLHMMLPPTTQWPQVTIAKRSESLTSLESMVQRGSLTEDMAHFIRIIVKNRQTIVFSGAGGSGKTTMLRACCNYINPDERVVICEDSPELDIPIRNVSYMESIPWRPGLDRNQEVRLSYLVAQANRMRCDRIIVGETRNEEFHGFLQSANSGYSGSMTTLHANSPTDCVQRMGGLDLDAVPGREISAVNRNIAEAVDFIIQLKKIGDRHVVHDIYQLSNTVNDRDGSIAGATIYKYDDVTGEFEDSLSNLDDRSREKFGITGNVLPYDDPRPTAAPRRRTIHEGMPARRGPGLGGLPLGRDSRTFG